MFKTIFQPCLGSCTDHSSGDTRDYGQGCYVGIDYGPCSDDSSSAHSDTGEHDGANSNPGIILYRNSPCIQREPGGAHMVLRRDDRYFWGDADVISNQEASSTIKNAISVDERVGSDLQTISRKLSGAKEPHKAPQVHSAFRPDTDAKHSIPG